MIAGDTKFVVEPDGPSFLSPYTALACAIIFRAVADWRLLIEEKAFLDSGQHATAPYVSFDEIRNFFKSDWCKELIPDHVTMTAEEMLELLEEELDRAKEEAGR